MGKKLSIEQVYFEIEKVGFKWISGEYKNVKSILTLQCSHGHIREYDFQTFKSGKSRCSICRDNERKEKQHLRFLEMLKLNNYTYLNGKYFDMYTPKYNVICSKGHNWNVNFREFKSGTRCPICMIEKNKNNHPRRLDEDDIYEMYRSEGYIPLGKYINIMTKIKVICPNRHEWDSVPNAFKVGSRCKYCFGAVKYTLGEAKEIFIDNGFIPIFDNYKNNREKMPYICSKHKDYGIQYTALLGVLLGYESCAECKKINYSGENHPMWKGGLKEIKMYLRSCIIDSWIKPSLRLTNYRCAITNINSNKIAVHHLNKNFNEILLEVFKITSLEVKRKTGDYTLEELLILRNTCIDLHEKYGLGIPILREIHVFFHRLYGFNNNNKEQFEEFQTRWNNGEFETLFIIDEKGVKTT